MQTFAQMVKHVDRFLTEVYPHYKICSGPRRGFVPQWQWKVDIVITNFNPEDAVSYLPDFLEPLNIEVESHEVHRGYRLKVGEKSKKRRGTIYLRSSYGDDFGALCLYYTGPVRFIEKLQKRAEDFGYILDPFGLWLRRELIAGKSEALIFDALGVKFIPPVERTNQLELTYLF